MVLVGMAPVGQGPRGCQHCLQLGHVAHRQHVHRLGRLLEAAALQHYQMRKCCLMTASLAVCARFRHKA